MEYGKLRAADLRIGNLVYYNNEPELTNPDIIEVETIQSDGINYIDGSVDYRIEDLKGIPLTGEWLDKFGFKIDGTKITADNLHNGSFILENWGDFIDNTNIELYYTAGESIKYSCQIKHVHQLQNLYFALTGEELTIK